MRKLLNTLYVLQEDVYLKLDNENIVAIKEREILFKIPFVNIESIVCFNYLGCSPALMGKCAENNVSLCFLKPNGKFLARVSGEIHGNVLLRENQFNKLSNNLFCLNLAKQTIKAKIANTRTFLMKESNDHVFLENLLKQTIEQLEKNIRQIDEINDLDNLRAIEGNSARAYFGIFENLVLQNKNDFTFNGRNKRPPLDYVNAMLSYLYTLLALDMQSALETVGLDPYIGFFHTERPGRPSLALDLMEEFRCYIVDRCVLSLINNRQIQKNNFEIRESGAVEMTEEGRKIILTKWQSDKKNEILHPIINEKIELGLFPYVQAQLLAKYLRGEMENYIPFEMK